MWEGVLDGRRHAARWSLGWMILITSGNDEADNTTENTLRVPSVVRNRMHACFVGGRCQRRHQQRCRPPQQHTKANCQKVKTHMHTLLMRADSLYEALRVLRDGRVLIGFRRL